MTVLVKDNVFTEPQLEKIDKELKLLTKKKGEIQEQSIIPVRFVPMIHGER